MGNKNIGPLNDIKVVELATVLAGPGVGRYLADFGAEVIKVESPEGDPTRRMGWTGTNESDSYFWKLINRNKSVISLDLKISENKEILWAIIKDVDVLIENFRPGKLAKLGFSSEELLKANPKLVILRLTGFGQTGPYSSYPGFATIVDALSGFSNLLGEPQGTPSLPPIALADELTALVGAFSVMLALRHAEKRGEGQEVDVNLLTSMFQIMGALPSAYAHMGYLQPRLGSGIPYTVPRGTYKSVDNIWLAISCSSDSVSDRVLNLLGLNDDPRFVNFQSRSKNRELLEGYVKEWVGKRTYSEVLDKFREADAAVGKVMSMEEIFTDEHFLSRDMITDVEGVQMQNLVAKLYKSPGNLRHPGRKFNQNSKEILRRYSKKKRNN